MRHHLWLKGWTLAAAVAAAAITAAVVAGSGSGASAAPAAVTTTPGGIFVTGHDPDFHAHLGGNAAGAQHIIQKSIDYVTFGAASPSVLLVTDLDVGTCASDSRQGLDDSGFTYDVADYGSGTPGVLDLNTVDLGDYDVVVIASDFGGCLKQSELDILNDRTNDLIDYVNAGGGVVAFSEVLTGAFGYFPFVSSTAASQGESGFHVTALGASMGLVDDDVNGNFSHSILTATGGLAAVDHDGAGNAISYAIRGATITKKGAGCNLVGSTLVMGIPAGGSITIGRSGTAFAVSGSGITDGTCGGATVNNVDRIEVTGSTGNETLKLDLRNGDFAPGATAEGSGTSEIELFYDGSDASDRLVIVGGSGDDTYTLGADGMNRNGDDDGDDVTLLDVEKVTVGGGGGKDRISGAGGDGTGSAYASPLTIDGDGGTDTLQGGSANDVVNGGAGADVFLASTAADGSDTFNGAGGKDTADYSGRTAAVNVSLEGGANDGELGEGDNVMPDVETVLGGKGADTLGDGGFVAPNTFKGGRGADVIQADDGVGGNDTVNGGTGTDSCTADVGDSVTACES